MSEKGLDTHENAAMAILSLNGYTLFGRQLKCSWGRERTTGGNGVAIGGNGIAAPPALMLPVGATAGGALDHVPVHISAGGGGAAMTAAGGGVAPHPLPPGFVAMPVPNYIYPQPAMAWYYSSGKYIDQGPIVPVHPGNPIGFDAAAAQAIYGNAAAQQQFWEAQPNFY
ncbi:hypothetical protein HDU83_001025 [Entophlyctis luteolus]|nr:hypothetical protein HDU83_001025 [Entophlyctis luteolus]